jgi:hypothetical protein
MKRNVTGFIFVLLLSAAPLLLAGQNPPAPNWGNDPYGSSSPVGGGASLGGGLVTLLALAAGYASRKIYTHRKRILE